MNEEKDPFSALALRIVKGLRNRGQHEITKMAKDSRRKLELRSLKKDKEKMYAKLGREVEALVEAGEIHHPGLLRGVERIRSLKGDIVRLEQNKSKELVEVSDQMEVSDQEEGEKK